MTGDVLAAVHALKDEPGDELQVWGSSKLLQTLLQHTVTDFGIVLGTYEPAGPVRHGHM